MPPHHRSRKSAPRHSTEASRPSARSKWRESARSGHIGRGRPEELAGGPCRCLQGAEADGRDGWFIGVPARPRRTGPVQAVPVLRSHACGTKQGKRGQEAPHPRRGRLAQTMADQIDSLAVISWA